MQSTASLSLWTSTVADETNVEATRNVNLAFWLIFGRNCFVKPLGRLCAGIGKEDWFASPWILEKSNQMKGSSIGFFSFFSMTTNGRTWVIGSTENVTRPHHCDYYQQKSTGNSSTVCPALSHSMLLLWLLNPLPPPNPQPSTPSAIDWLETILLLHVWRAVRIMGVIITERVNRSCHRFIQTEAINYVLVTSNRRSVDESSSSASYQRCLLIWKIQFSF